MNSRDPVVTLGDSHPVVQQLMQRQLSLRKFAAAVAPEHVDGDDLFHDALVRVLRAAKTTEIHHPVAYTKRTIVSLASNQRRRWKRRRSAITRLQNRPEATWSEFGGASEDHSDLSSLLNLPPRQRAALYLKVVEDLDTADIADQLGCTPDAARQLLSRAAGALRAEEGQLLQ